MTGNKGIILKHKEENVYFGDNGLVKILGKGMVILGDKKSKEENVFLIESIKHNLPSVIQMYDQGHSLSFDSRRCKIRNRDT